MPNYRGGDNSVSPYMAEALRAIKSGTAPYQRRRDLWNRAIVGGTQAALQGIGGIARAAYQSEVDHDAQIAARNKNQEAANKQQIGIDDFQARLDNAKQETMMRAISNAKQERDDVSFIKYGTEDEKTAKERLRGYAGRIDNAEAGVANPYGDVWNRRAFDDAHDEASLLANDIGVAKSIIKGQSDWERNRHGLGGSLQTWGQ